ncbi:hypothetical protein FRC01_003594 [Tulasnella sp. 417]|nr:hypothetical protein FRC01_003594 [Tulasnella sp. 417]
MWNEAQNYSTSLGTVLVQVCKELPRAPASKFRVTVTGKDGQSMKNIPETEDSKIQSTPAVDIASNLLNSSKSLTTEDEAIEEMPAPAVDVRTTSTSSSPTALNIQYPEPKTFERMAYKTSGGKTITQHHWDVYDFIRTIPKVGAALRNNPFAPYIPCHRVIASNFFVGGFCGEWGPQSKSGTQYHRKLELLKEEGVTFDPKGKLANMGYLWNRRKAA